MTPQERQRAIDRTKQAQAAARRVLHNPTAPPEVRQAARDTAVFEHGVRTRLESGQQ